MNEAGPKCGLPGGHQEQLVACKGHGSAWPEEVFQGRRNGAVELFAFAFGEMVEERGDHSCPVAEVVAYRPVRQAGGRFDGANGQARGAGLAEYFQRGVQQPGASRFLHTENIRASLFSVWRIEGELPDAGTAYDRRAAVYDRLVRSPTYNRLAWSTTPDDYTAFAAAAIASADGPLLEAAAGSAAATADLHAHSRRPTTLVDSSRPMLERAARRIAAAHSAHGDEIPACIRLLQADLLDLPLPPGGFTTVLALGLTHLFDNVPALVTALSAQLATGGELHLAGLVAETRRGRRYLGLLHRAGEAARPRTADELHALLGQPTAFRNSGCMAYATLPAAPKPTSP